MRVETHVDAAHAAHLAMGWLDMQANAQLLVHALLQALELFETLQVLEAFEQALLLLPGQQQDARIGTGGVQQFITLTIAGTRRAGVAHRQG